MDTNKHNSDGKPEGAVTRARRAGALALSVAAPVFLAAAVALWFWSGGRWEFWVTRVSMRDWANPWLIATGLWLVRGLIAAGPSWLGRLPGRLAGALEGRAGIEWARLGGRPSAGWVLWGVIIGGAAGALFTVHYFYLVRWRTVQVAVVPAIALGSGLLHWGYFRAASLVLSRAWPGLTEDRKRVVVQAFYLAAIGVGVAAWGRSWEPRLTEPIFMQAAYSLSLGLVLAWFAAGRRLKAAAAAWLITLVLGLALDLRTASRLGAPRDRVVFVTLDTVRWDHLSCYGYHRPTTPNLDALAEGGARFERVYAPMAVTDPSHATMFTGLYPRTHGVKVPAAGRLHKHFPAISETFRDHGFATAAIASRMLLDPWRIGLPGFQHASAPRFANSSAPDARRRALNWLWKNRGRDVFLWVHFFDPHQPYRPHPGFTELFTDAKLRAKSGNKWLDPEKRYSQEQIQERIDLYDGEIRYMDHHLGKLLADLAALGPAPARPALVIVVADHGEMLAEKQDPPVGYGFGHGGVLYEPAVRVPLIVSWPGQVAEGLVVEGTVELVDLAPTMSELVFGQDFPCQGRSLVPGLRGEALAEGPAFLERDRVLAAPRAFLELDQFAVARWPFKLFHAPGSGVELYDLAADPGETEDLSSLNPERAEEVLGLLEEWYRETPEAEPVEHEFTPGELEKLRDLGYIQ